MQDTGVLQKMDEDWKRLLGQHTNDEQEITADRPLSPQDVLLAFISLTIGISIALTTLLFEHLVIKITK